MFVRCCADADPSAPSSGCATVPVSCDDGDPCTEDACEPTAGCVHMPIPGCASLLCGDGECNPSEAASGGCPEDCGCQLCSPSSPAGVCDDGNPNTLDACDPVVCQCVYTLSNP